MPTIKISSDFYTPPTDISLALSRPFNMILGHNGSGKSTIADAFKKYSENDESLLTISPSLTDEQRKHIYVFNEKFIRDNVEVKDDGLRTIIMFGEAGDLSKEEEKRKAELDTATQAYNAAVAAKDNAETAAGNLEIKIEHQLKSDTGYAARGRDIKGATNKIQAKIVDILSKANDPSVVAGDVITLSKEVSTGIARIKALKDGTPVSWSTSVMDVPSFVAEVKDLCSRKIDQPKLSDREVRIIALLQKGYNFVEQSKSVLLDGEADFCPLCQQSIPHSHLGTLSDSIQRIETEMNDAAGAYRRELEDAIKKCSAGGLDFTAMGYLFGDERNGTSLAHGKYQAALWEIADILQKRLNNVFAAPENIDTTRLENAYNYYKSVLSTLDRAIANYNNDLKAVASLRSALLEKNKCLAYLENKADIVKYLQEKANVDVAEKSMSTAQKAMDSAKAELQRIHAQMEQTEIALDFINSCLNYIFFSSDRLKLVQETDKSGVYTLYSNGHVVSPDKVSVGERNAIGLAYYFALSFADKSKNDIYSDEAIYVIDDPVSSFDRSNRVGIMTFLKEQFYNIFSGNTKSKVLVLSHDLHTVNDLATMAKNIFKTIGFGDEVISKMETYPYYELANKKLQETKGSTSNYRQLMFDLFNYASGSDAPDSASDSIGNKMRRLMESYSSFNYNMGVESMLNNDTVLASMPVEYRTFYRRLAAMLVLNGESHSDLRIDAMDSFSSVYSASDFRKLAKQLLLFICLTNRTHLAFMLGERNMPTVASWKSVLPADTVSKEKEEKAARELGEKMEYYGSNEFEVERDSWGRYHCEECMLPNAASYVYETNCNVRLISIAKNTDPYSKKEYPFFARYEKVW